MTHTLVLPSDPFANSEAGASFLICVAVALAAVAFFFLFPLEMPTDRRPGSWILHSIAPVLTLGFLAFAIFGVAIPTGNAHNKDMREFTARVTDWAHDRYGVDAITDLTPASASDSLFSHSICPTGEDCYTASVLANGKLTAVTLVTIGTKSLLVASDSSAGNLHELPTADR